MFKRLVLVVLALGCATPQKNPASFQFHPNDQPNRVYKKENVEGCLDKAYAKMLEHNKAYKYLKRFLEKKTSYKDLLAVYPRTQDKFFKGFEEGWGVSKSIFLNFDGGWKGKGDKHKKTREVGFALSWDVQPIMIKEGKEFKKGMKLVDSTGTICGILIDAPDSHRLSEGLFFLKGKNNPEYIKWMVKSPSWQSNFYTWLDWTKKGRRYHSQEHKVDDSGNFSWERSAKFKQWKTKTKWVMSSIAPE